MNSEDKNMAMLAHLLGLFASFVGPLIIYLLAKTDEVKEHARNALNFQIVIAIAYVIASVLTFVVIGILLVPIIMILNLIFTIMGAIKVHNGEQWKYPITFDFIK